MNEASVDPELLAEETARAARGARLLVATDFDGTLAELVSRPDAARLVPGAREGLGALVDVACVAVLSGRSLDDLGRRVPVPSITLAGEHGGDILWPTGEKQTVVMSPRTDEALDRFAEAARRLVEPEGGWVERKRLAVAAHTRLVPVAERAALETALVREASQLGSGRDTEVIRGKCIVELRHVKASKGLGLRAVRRGLGHTGPVVALGDDATDDDLFDETIAAGGTAVRVGPGESHASRRLADPAAVAGFLQALARRLAGPRRERS